MASLAKEYRRQLERVIVEARRTGEKGAINALKALAVDHHEPLGGMTKEQRDLRNRLRAHGRQLGDQLDRQRGTQGIGHLASECAYEHWHRMLFARFLAENNLLIEPDSKMPLTLDECRELAREKNVDWLELASSYAVEMLPQIFRADDPILEVALPPETRKELEELLESLPMEVFASDDSLGWVYQFWQTDRKKQINDSGERIGPDEISPVTQLFTEDYMVLFLLHNTLGAWWNAKRTSEGKSTSLSGYEWEYLRLKEDGTPAAGSFTGWPRSARELKILDPSMGSGHFLVFALPILVRFRMEEELLSCEQALEAVLRDNLFGLEIDNRCTQIAAFNIAFTSWRMTGYRALPSLNIACSGLGINASKEEWLRLAGTNDRLRDTLEALYTMFRQAPILGTLIDPKRLGGTLFSARFDEVKPLLEQALSSERNEEVSELKVAAKGIVKAAQLLGEDFTLVVTNVPYLVRAKQSDQLREYCEFYAGDAAADLATVFLERCSAFLEKGGTSATVTPQNWCFLRSYTDFRRRLLASQSVVHVTKIGSGATATASWDVLRALAVISNGRPTQDLSITGLEADSPAEHDRANEIRTGPVLSGSLTSILATRDARLALGVGPSGTLLAAYANSLQGISTGDNPRFQRLFWEITRFEDWGFQQGPVSQTIPFGGREKVIYWESGSGELSRHEGSAIRGLQALGRCGVAITQMRELPATLFSGTFFDTNVAVILPKDDSHLRSIWAYCSSPQFVSDVRKIDKKINVTNATLTQAPFDLAHWNSVASDLFKAGFPRPEVDDPTQWLFDGDPASSNNPLHVALLRLCGFLWPRQIGCSFTDCPAIEDDQLREHADSDGIVCLTAVKGETGAAERLRMALSIVYSREWSGSKQAELLSQIGWGGYKLEDWLRDGFFEEHCEMFQQRPAVWHVWDGLKNGFSALVNYHKLVGAKGEGKRTLEKLIYTYLGEWLDRQRADQKNSVEGSDVKLAAAEHLQKELKKILHGESPYDIFVRWKPLHEQPIGWEPDMNDGVRINIRPFMTAKVLNGRGKSCILRSTPKIKLEKDRGKEPHRKKEEFPWFWSWDEQSEDFMGGREFDGNRWNDLHYSTKMKREARERHKEKEQRKGAGR